MTVPNAIVIAARNAAARNIPRLARKRRDGQTGTGIKLIEFELPSVRRKRVIPNAVIPLPARRMRPAQREVFAVLERCGDDPLRSSPSKPFVAKVDYLPSSSCFLYDENALLGSITSLPRGTALLAMKCAPSL